MHIPYHRPQGPPWTLMKPFLYTLCAIMFLCDSFLASFRFRAAPSRGSANQITAGRANRIKVCLCVCCICTRVYRMYATPKRLRHPGDYQYHSMGSHCTLNTGHIAQRKNTNHRTPTSFSRAERRVLTLQASRSHADAPT